MISRMLLLLTAVGLLSCSATVEAAYTVSLGSAEPSSGIDVKAEVLFEQAPPTGFCPLRVRIQNRSSSAHTWTLGFTHSDNMFGFQNPATMSWKTELSVAAGETGEWDLLVPLASLNAARAGYVSINGRITGYGITGERFGLPSRYSGGIAAPFVVISESLADAVWSQLEAETKSATSPATSNLLSERFTGHSSVHSRSSGRTLEGSKLDLKLLPADWRALSGVSGLWMTIEEWLALPLDKKRAVRQWIGAGGHLFVAGREISKVGLPLLPVLPEAGKRVPLGLGGVESVQLEDKKLPVPATAKAIINLDNSVFPAWVGDHRHWSLAGSLGWPSMNVKLIILFVTLFAVVIGPVNLRALAPPKHRYRLFFTVPLLSIAASVVLFGVIALGDGFGGSGYRNALVYLPTGENTATVSQEQVSRSRLLLGRGFSVPDEASFSLAQLRSDNNGRMSLERSGDSATGDWFRSRAVQAHLLRAIVPTRAEVVLQNPGAAGAKPVLLSSVAGRLTDVVYVDAEGKHWRTEQLPTGTPVTLEPSSSTEWLPWKNRNTTDLSQHLKEAISNVEYRRGHFYAIAESLPEAPLATLPGIRWEKDRIVCFGPCVKGDVK